MKSGHPPAQLPAPCNPCSQQPFLPENRGWSLDMGTWGAYWFCFLLETWPSSGSLLHMGSWAPSHLWVLHQLLLALGPNPSGPLTMSVHAHSLPASSPTAST